VHVCVYVSVYVCVGSGVCVWCVWLFVVYMSGVCAMFVYVCMCGVCVVCICVCVGSGVLCLCLCVVCVVGVYLRVYLCVYM